LFLHDPASDELWSCATQGPGDSKITLRLPVKQSLTGRVFRTHQPLCVKDSLTEEEFFLTAVVVNGFLPRSMLMAPVLKSPGQCIGVVQVLDQQVNAFDADDLALLEAIATQVAITLDNARLYEAQKRQFASFVRAFSAALDARDPLTAIHSINVANYAMGIGYFLGLASEELEWLRMAGLLHDVGKIGVREGVLTKPGQLSDEEMNQMRQHASYSFRILSQIEFTDEYRGMDHVAAAHHERLDGSGYPRGLSDGQISFKARILAVADVFDAMTQDRHYRKGMSMEQALAEVDRMTPHQLDGDCVVALKRFLGRGG
jgi:putative nucleotidyltransferase with HDIG domain